MRFPEDFVQAAGVWVPRASGGTLNYSDGAQCEHYLRGVLTEADDLTCRSPQLRDAMCDWPSRYHLSPERSNLLRCLSLAEGAHVLELGAGCGAITRYLGQTVESVLAVEGNPVRAGLCRLRCRDLSGVQVVAADAFSLQLHEHYDVVTLIGVLEYAGVYANGDGDPWQRLLQLASDRLRPGGQLVVAIENQLGLKYFTGCGEDHGQPRFSGIEGYPEQAGVRTFGRVELTDRLARAGLHATELVLPFPDYKVPNTLINAAHCQADSASRLGLADWCRRPFADYARPRDYLFDDHLALAQFAKNGLLADVSNSFLMIGTKQARREDSPIAPLDWVARRYNPLRFAAYQTVTTLRTDHGAPTIDKCLLEPEAAKAHDNDRLLHSVASAGEYVVGGQTLAMEMLRALRRRNDAEQHFGQLLAQWLGFFRPEHSADGDMNRLHGQFVDCIPDNLVRDAEGQLHYVDREWCYTESVTIDWVFYRGLVSLWEHHALAIAGAHSRVMGTRRHFIGRAFDLLGSPIDDAQWHQMAQQEAELQQVVRYGHATDPGGAPGSGPGALRWALPGRTCVVRGVDLALD